MRSIARSVGVVTGVALAGCQTYDQSVRDSLQGYIGQPGAVLLRESVAGADSDLRQRRRVAHLHLQQVSLRLHDQGDGCARHALHHPRDFVDLSTRLGKSVPTVAFNVSDAVCQ